MWAERFCAVCGTGFRPKKPNAVTCSGRCRTQKHRRGHTPNLIDPLRQEKLRKAVEELAGESTPEKRKRGRPRQAATVLKAVTLPASKRRGRPRKTPAVTAK